MIKTTLSLKWWCLTGRLGFEDMSIRLSIYEMRWCYLDWIHDTCMYICTYCTHVRSYMNIYIYGNDVRSHIRIDMWSYIYIYTYTIHVSFLSLHAHRQPWVDRPKLKESFTAMDVVLNLSWDVEVVGVAWRQQKTLREFVVFLRPKNMYNFFSCQTFIWNYSILIYKIWIETYCWNLFFGL